MKSHDAQMLRRYDEDIARFRQVIDKCKLEISSLEEARLTLIRMAEREELGEASPLQQLTAVHEKPIMIVRAQAEAVTAQTTREERTRERLRLREHDPKRRNYKREYERRKAEERRAILAKYGQVDAPDEVNGQSLDQRLDKARKERSDKGVKGKRTGRHRQYTDQVLRIFTERPATPLMTKEVMDLIFPDRVPDKASKQAVYQCLYDLKKAGELAQVQQGEPYTLVR